MGSDVASLAVARRLLDSALGTSFQPIPETDAPTADLRSFDGAHVAEVKRITSESLRELSQVMGRYETSRDVPELTRRWLVLLKAQTNSDTLPPMPAFPEPSPAVRAHYEAAGMTVQTRAEREAEFRAEHPGPRSPRPQVKQLIDRLIPHFQVLEAHDVGGDSQGWVPWFATDPVSTAKAEILRAIEGGMVSSFVPETVPAGVDLHLGWGYSRTGCADTIVGRIQTWLDSDLARNLRQSLGAGPPEARRHAVLVFDLTSEPEFEALSRADGALAEQALHLPPEVDAVWAVFDDRALAYDGRGWSGHHIASEAA